MSTGSDRFVCQKHSQETVHFRAFKNHLLLRDTFSLASSVSSDNEALTDLSYDEAIKALEEFEDVMETIEGYRNVVSRTQPHEALHFRVAQGFTPAESSVQPALQ